MSAARKLKVKPELRTYHASMLVTRAEDWWVEAESVEEARALLASGEGQRSAVGACVHLEIDGMLDAGGE
jgi:hypothetical protein